MIGRSMNQMLARVLIALFLPLSLILVRPAEACDLCAIYSVTDKSRATPGTFRLGVAEQFSSFGTIQQSGAYVENSGSQHMESSITQLFARYDLTDSVSLQANLPYISRRYRRIEDGMTDRGTEAGIGDLSLLARYMPFADRQENWSYMVQVFGGIKLPTGDADRLKEDSDGEHHKDDQHGDDVHEESGHDDESDHMDAHSVSSRGRVSRIHNGIDHGDDEITNVIHGHDLALGSGSVDFPIGFDFFAQSDRAFVQANLQYVFRTEGEADYQYADDLLWKVGPGYYVALDHDSSVALKVNLSGEYKRKDTIDGEHDDDTGLRSLFIGPEVSVSIGDWAGELAWDIPLDVNNTGTQVVIDYKIRATLTRAF